MTHTIQFNDETLIEFDELDDAMLIARPDLRLFYDQIKHMVKEADGDFTQADEYAAAFADLVDLPIVWEACILPDLDLGEDADEACRAFVAQQCSDFIEEWDMQYDTSE